jgi:HSP20 family protein
MLITRAPRVPDLASWSEFGTLPNRLARLLGPSFFAPFNAEPFTFSPPLDVAEYDDWLLVTAELPGLTRNEIKVEVVDGMLMIRGEKKEKKEEKTDRMYTIERSFGVFERTFALPSYLDLDKITAEFINGVLSIKIPKLAPEKGRKVEILEK